MHRACLCSACIQAGGEQGEAAHFFLLAVNCQADSLPGQSSLHDDDDDDDDDDDENSLGRQIVLAGRVLFLKLGSLAGSLRLSQAGRQPQRTIAGRQANPFLRI